MTFSDRFPPRVLLFGLGVALLTALPSLVAWAVTPDGWQYNGAPVNPAVHPDYTSHVAKMWQGERGQWAYELLFTSEPHNGILFVQSFYVALGAVAGVLSLDFPVMFHLTKFALAFLMVLALWRFGSHFFEQRRERWTFLWFATFVSGTSWLLLIINPTLAQELSPIEFWLMDAFHLLGALYMPHFIAAIILQIVIVLTFNAWVYYGGLWRIGVLTVALAAESFIQPYVVVLFIPLLGMLAAYHVFVAKKLTFLRALWLALPLFVHGALALYQYLAMEADPVWAHFVEQNQTLSPPLEYYLLGFLPFILPIVLGARAFLLDRPDDRGWLPLLWLVIVAALLYAPFPTQRRYLLGAQTPLAVLAAYGWTRAMMRRVRPRLRGLLTAAYVVIAFLGIGIVFINDTGRAFNPQSNQRIYTLPDQQAALAALRSDTEQRGATVLEVPTDVSNVVMGLGQRVYIGHPFETADFANKQAQIDRFLGVTVNDAWRRDFLRDNDIAYIWISDEVVNESEWTPETSPLLTTLFTSDTVQLYRVDLEAMN